MTTITRDDITKLAGLSNLHLNDAEVHSLQNDVAAILQYVEQLNELDTEGVQPAYQVTGLENVTRSDTVVDSTIDREALLSLSAEIKDNQIKVPKVL